MRLLHDHAVLPESLVIDREVSFMAKGLYAFLILSRRSEVTTARGIAMTMRENEPAVQSALRELQAKGYLILDDEDER